MNKIRFGITGSGYMGRTHAEAIKLLDQSATLVALWGGSRAPALADRYGIACEKTLEALVQRPDIDAVVIATPHKTHANEAVAALESGKHVMIEKPMATTLEDCDRIIAAAARGNLVISVGYTLRFRSNPIRARELLSQGAIGPLLTLQMSQLMYLGHTPAANYPWYRDPENLGFLIDALPHTVDFVRWSTGADVSRVAAFCRTFNRERPLVEDTTAGLLEFSNGMICTTNVSCALPAPFPGEVTRIRMIGKTGILDFDAFGDMHISDGEKWRLVCSQPHIAYAHPDDAFRGARIKSYCDQMQSFIDGVHGLPMQAGNGADGRAGVAAALGMLTSSREHRLVEVH